MLFVFNRVELTMVRRPLPAVRDLPRDGRWSTYVVSVLKKMGGRCSQTRNPPKLSPTKLARLGHFPSASQAGRLGGPVFYVYCICLFSGNNIKVVPALNFRLKEFFGLISAFCYCEVKHKEWLKKLNVFYNFYFICYDTFVN
jgi:hypothetical protein